jgi:hypothetical protein
MVVVRLKFDRLFENFAPLNQIGISLDVMSFGLMAKMFNFIINVHGFLHSWLCHWHI